MDNRNQLSGVPSPLGNANKFEAFQFRADRVGEKTTEGARHNIHKIQCSMEGVNRDIFLLQSQSEHLWQEIQTEGSTCNILLTDLVMATS